MRRGEYIVRCVASILIIWGLYEIFSQAKDTWFMLRYGFFASNIDLKDIAFFVLFLLFSVVIPLAAIISGWGLLKLHPRARLVALSISVLTFVLTFLRTIEFTIRSYYFRDVPVPEIPEGAVAFEYSMWPTYIIALASGALVLLLRRESVKKLFVAVPNVNATNS